MSIQPNTTGNGDANDGPTLWSTDTYEVGLVTVATADPLEWDVYIRKRMFDSTEWETFNLADIPGNPLDLPVRFLVSPGVPDTHYKIASVMVDAARFIHVSGNQHQSVRKYVKSTIPDDITTLADASSLIDNTGTGVDVGLGSDNLAGYSYNKFEIDHEGNRYWYFLQTDRTESPRVAGRDAILMWLPNDPDADWSQEWEFAPGTVNGEIAVCNETVSDGDPERVYTSGFLFRESDNLMGWFGVWQDTHDDANTRGELYYVQQVYGSGQWTSIDGTPVAAPLTRAAVQAAGCQLPDQIDPILADWRPAFDADGHPHIIVSDGGPNYRHHWWDGAAWQYETSPLGGGGGGHLILIRGVLWRTRTSGNEYSLYSTGNPSSRVRLSGTVDDTFYPPPDPVRALRGEFAVMSPANYEPRSFSFGAGPRGNIAP